MDFQIWGVVTYIIHKSSMIGLSDCNNFYASCERVFNPKLERNQWLFFLITMDVLLQEVMKV